MYLNLSLDSQTLLFLIAPPGVSKSSSWLPFKTRIGYCFVIRSTLFLRAPIPYLPAISSYFLPCPSRYLVMMKRVIYCDLFCEDCNTRKLKNSMLIYLFFSAFRHEHIYNCYRHIESLQFQSHQKIYLTVASSSKMHFLSQS